MKLPQRGRRRFLPQQIFLIQEENEALVGQQVDEAVEEPQGFQQAILASSPFLLQGLVVVGHRDEEDDGGAIVEHPHPLTSIFPLAADVGEPEDGFLIRR